jgi:hypothetical protein
MMTACAAEPGQSERPGRTTARVLRWTFRRGADEAFVCELGLDRRESAYQLRLNGPTDGAADSVEFFRDAIAALMRQATIERTLVRDGWSLERFETHQHAA